MKKDKNNKNQVEEPKTNKYGEEEKKKYNPVKRAFVILGIGLAAIIGLVGIAAIVAVATGAWSNKPIQIESLSFQTEFDTEGGSSNTVNVLDDFKIKINYLPEKANVLDVDLKFVNGVGSNVIEIPEKVKAGEEITIKVKKDANGLNIGGEALLEAGTGLVKTSDNLKVFVDVPIPTDGLKLASNFDGKEITSGSQNIKFYVFTDPKTAINPNTGEVPDLTKAFKNITLTSGNTQALTINGTGTVRANMFYCPNYIEHGHEPFLTTKTHTYNNGIYDLGEPTKCVEFSANVLGGTEVPIIINAKALRTYSMEADYVAITDAKYATSDGVNRQLFFEDLSAYIQKYQNFIKTDTRSFSYQNYTYENGLDYINRVTQTNSAGESYIKINDNNTEYEAALFYLFVQTRKTYNVEKIEIDKIQSSLNNESDRVKFQLHGEIVQLSFNEFKNMFGLSLIPTNTVDFTSADLDSRINELKIITVMDKGANSASPYNNIEIVQEKNPIFEIDNPPDIAHPIWRIKCINPKSSEQISANVRFRIYLPNDNSGVYNDNCLWIDIPFEINENGIKIFEFKPNHGIITNMVVNNENVGGSVNSQPLTENAYDLEGFNNQTPTYTTVKWFADVAQAKTLGTDGVTRSDYFKVKLTNSGNPKAYQMPYDNETVSGYEITYSEGGKIVLKALNASNVYQDNDPLQIFAAIVRTNYDGIPVDSNGNAQYIYDYATNQYILNEQFSNYVIVKRTEGVIEITTEYFLENLNIYTKNSENGTYALRNVGTGETDELRIKLLADESYTLYATGYRLLADGSIDAGYYSNTDGIDKVSNIKYAMTNAENNKTVKVRINNSQDTRQYVTLGTEDSFRFNSTTGIWEIDVDALIDKTATNATTGAFDLSTYGVGTLENVFKQADSTVNMKVNYAELTKFDLKTNFTEKNPDTDEDYVYHNNFILRPQITSASGIEWRASVNNGTSTISAENEFQFELEYDNDLITTEGNFNTEKIDSSCAYSSYVNSYINKVFNPENEPTIGVNWLVTFANGTTAGIDEYITVRHEVVEEQIEVEGGDPITVKYFKPILNIKKGTPGGVEVVVNCIVGLYRTNTGYIQQKQSSLTLTLKQSEVSYEVYSEKEYNGNKILVANSVGVSNAQIMEGGEDNKINLLENLTPDSEAGLLVYTSGVNGAYNPVMVDGVQLSRRHRVIANLDTDNKLAGYCTYSIDGYQIKNVPIYFKNALGQKVYEITPTDVGGEKELYVYAEYISSDTEAQIIINSPFGGRTATYNIIVKSSVQLVSPSENLVATTTKSNKVSIGDNDDEVYSAKGNGGNIDLTNYYKANYKVNDIWTPQLISFDVDVNSNNFGRTEVDSKKPTTKVLVKNNNGTTTEEYLKTLFYPENVFETQTVILTMYYYLANGDGTYTKYTVNTIKDNQPISISVQSGFDIELNMGNSVVETSGSTINLFEKYGSVPESFIRFKNRTTNEYVPVDLITGENGLLKRLISFEYNEDAIIDLDLYNQLFASNADKLAINSGVLKTQSINSNFELPIMVKFKAGASGGTIQSMGSSAVFTITLNASLSYVVSGNNIEGSTYDSTQNDNIINGHTYSSVNTTVENNEYKIAPLNQTLYALGNVNNIISLTGGAGEDLLSSKFVSIKALKFDADQEAYVDYNLSDEFAKFDIITTTDNNLLQSLVLSVKRAVNQTEHFKLEITTSYGAYNDVLDRLNNKFDYYFTLNPVTKAVVSYPIESEGYERVNVNSKIDLLTSFINENNRLRLFEGDNNYYSIVKPTGSETRYAIVKNGVTNYLPQGVKPFSYKVIEGPAVVNDTLIEFTTPTSQNRVVVRCSAFNGATVDYIFNVFTGASSIIIEPKNPTIFAENAEAYNLFSDKFLSISNEPSGIKYVIKYQSISNGLYVGEKSNANKITSTNQTLEYTNNLSKVLNMWFDDVSNVNGVKVKFFIWHNYNVEGDRPVELEITLLPNLILTLNNNLNTFAAGTESVVMSNVESDNVFIKLGNTLLADLAKINLEVSAIKPADEQNFRAVTDNDRAKYGLTITSETTGNNKTYKLTTYNIENEIGIKFKVSKNDYYYEYEAKLSPNINFNVNYLVNGNTDSNFYIFTGAAASNELKYVTLNNVITPRTLDNQLISTESKTDVEFGLRFYIIENGKPNYNVSHIITSVAIADNVFGFSVAAVNKEYIIYGDLSISWKTNIPAGTSSITYTDTINLRLVPNLTETPVEYSENGVNYLKVYAGSEISINFNDIKNGKDIAVRVQQGTDVNEKFAKINATQINTNDKSENVNVVLRAKSGDNYWLTEDNKLTIGKYIDDSIISFDIYYDLTGKLSGVIKAAAGDGAPFNDETKLYKSRYTLQIQIVPSLNSITYKTVDGNKLDYSTSENAYILTPNLTRLDEISFVKDINGEISSPDPYGSSDTKANEIKLTDVFDIAPEAKLSYTTSDTSKVWVNKQTLLNNIEYSVKAKSGPDFDRLTKELTQENAENCVKFDVRPVGSDYALYAIFAIPNSDDGLAYEFAISITLPGVSNATSSAEIYVRFEITSEKHGQLITPVPSTGTTNEAHIGWTDSSPIKLDANNRILLTGKNGNTQGLFRLGYLLGSAPISDGAYSNSWSSVSNVSILKRGTVEYYVYELNNVNFNTTIEGSITYASIVNIDGYNYLQIDPYYATVNNSATNRNFTVQINCGTITQRFTFIIDPIVVTHEVSASSPDANGVISITNKLVNNGTEINATSKEVTLVTSGLSEENANIVKSWLVKTGNEYKIVPNRYQISEPVTFGIQTHITVGTEEIDSQVFDGQISAITINPIVNFQPTILSVVPNSKGANLSYTIAGTDVNTSIINSNIFSYSGISNVNVTLSLSNTLVDYSKYIQIKNADKVTTDSTDVYTIKNNSVIEIISQNLLEDIRLKFTAVATYLNDGTPYTYEKEFTFAINKNAGISNISSSYRTNETLTESQTSATVNGGNAQITGAGEFAYEVTGVAATLTNGSFGTITNEQVKITITKNASNVITMFNLDWAKLKADYASQGISNIREFTVTIYYKDGDDLIVVKEGVKFTINRAA